MSFLVRELQKYIIIHYITCVCIFQAFSVTCFISLSSRCSPPDTAYARPQQRQKKQNTSADRLGGGVFGSIRLFVILAFSGSYRLLSAYICLSYVQPIARQPIFAPKPSSISPSGATFSLYDRLRMNADMTAVSISAMGKVSQTVFWTSSKHVNTYAAGKTNTTSRSSEMMSGLRA